MHSAMRALAWAIEAFFSVVEVRNDTELRLKRPTAMIVSKTISAKVMTSAKPRCDVDVGGQTDW